jgi:hypothetical protein
MPDPLASATTAILITFAVALVAATAGGLGIYASLGSEDKGHMRTLLRHPLRTIFSESEPDPDPEDEGER